MNKLFSQIAFGLSNFDIISELKFAFANPTLLSWRMHGLNIHLLKKLQSKYFQSLNINTIYDVGANIGQSTMMLHLAFPKADIHVFEPLPECFSKLNKMFGNIPKISLNNIALGDEIGTISFEQNEFSASSSVLAMTKEHIENFSFTSDRSIINVPINTLDNYKPNHKAESNLLIKIDVQGYEDRVIKGGEMTIGQAKVLIIETSFSQLYEGEALFSDIYNHIISLGFTYKGAFDQLKSPKTGEILQQDAIFVK
jgi:FkbM family methyltransferase